MPKDPHWAFRPVPHFFGPSTPTKISTHQAEKFPAAIDSVSDPITPWLPEHYMLAEILHDAAKCITGRNQRERRDAREWFLSDDEEVMTFIWIARQLKIEHLIQEMRRYILGEGKIRRTRLLIHKERRKA